MSFLQKLTLPKCWLAIWLQIVQFRNVQLRDFLSSSGRDIEDDIALLETNGFQHYYSSQHDCSPFSCRCTEINLRCILLRSPQAFKESIMKLSIVLHCSLSFWIFRLNRASSTTICMRWRTAIGWTSPIMSMRISLS